MEETEAVLTPEEGTEEGVQAPAEEGDGTRALLDALSARFGTDDPAALAGCVGDYFTQADRAEQARRESAAESRVRAWLTEAEALRSIYPSFDIDRELSDPRFGQLLTAFDRVGLTDAVQTAFETLHRAALRPAAMRYAAEAAREAAAAGRLGTAARESENGTGGRVSARTAADPSTLTRAQIEDIRRRAAAGERISF